MTGEQAAPIPHKGERTVSSAGTMAQESSATEGESRIDATMALSVSPEGGNPGSTSIFKSTTFSRSNTVGRSRCARRGGGFRQSSRRSAQVLAGVSRGLQRARLLCA